MTATRNLVPYTEPTGIGREVADHPITPSTGETDTATARQQPSRLEYTRKNR